MTAFKLLSGLPNEPKEGGRRGTDRQMEEERRIHGKLEQIP